jgi:hypothetical protein
MKEMLFFILFIAHSAQGQIVLPMTSYDAEPSIPIGLQTQYWRGDKTWQPLNQDAVPSGTVNKAFTASNQDKLASIATGATSVSNTNQLTNGAGFITSSDLSAGLGTKQNSLGYSPLNPANNLSEVTPATARTNLGLGSLATQSAGSVNITGGNLSNVTLTGATLTGTSIPLADVTGGVTILPQSASVTFL